MSVEGGIILYRIIKEGFSDKVTFEWTCETSNGVSHGSICGKSLLGKRNSKCKA